MNVKLDRWNMTAGKRLWDQIANFISNRSESDAWLFYATQNSLASEPCREELAYALDRALKSRGEEFPMIALFPSSVEQHLIPASIRVRLFVSLSDPDWKERVVAAVEGRSLSAPTIPVQPFVMQSISPVPDRSSSRLNFDLELAYGIRSSLQFRHQKRTALAWISVRPTASHAEPWRRRL